MLIYKATNIKTGKAYIGKTVRPLKSRWHRHIKASANGSKTAFHLAIAKYGPDSFVLSVLSHHSTKEELLSAEIKAIETHETRCPKGYNITIGGDSGGGWFGKRSPEFCQRVSERMKICGMSPEIQKKGWNASKGNSWNKGRIRTEEHRRKISETKRAQKLTAWNKGLKMPALSGNQHASGYRHSEEAKRRIGLAAKGNIYAKKTVRNVQAA